jgi:N-acetyl sugar amidotransferase
MQRPFHICSRCIMDTTDPDIQFDESGICNHCKNAFVQLNSKPYCLEPSEKAKWLEHLVSEIKESGKNKKYDCIIGLSGGVDSSYVAYKVKESGLRPLAVHLDNGWDSELSVKNIENICNKLNIDLFTYVINWEEFKDLQLSFLKASTPDSEIPSDHAIVSILCQMADKNNVRYILAGVNISSESILPRAWSQGHSDWKYIKSVQHEFGTVPLKTFPHRSRTKQHYYSLVKKIEWISFLDYLEYDKEKAKKYLMDKIGFRDYGRKHHESNYTKIYQSYILPTKFGYDKRKAHLSSLICAGQITRVKALEIIKEPFYSAEALEEDIHYLVNKFGISRERFEQIMALPPKTYLDYPHYYDTWFESLGRNVLRILRGNEKDAQ